MKLDRIRINKSPQQPEGVEIELVKPENPNEENLLAFLLTGYIRDLKHDGRLPYDLPDKFGVRSEIDVYVRQNDIEVTGQPIQTEVVPILALPK